MQIQNTSTGQRHPLRAKESSNLLVLKQEAELNNALIIKKYVYIYNIRTLSVNIKFICTSFRNRQNSEPSASFSGPFRSEYKWILYLTTMYVFCVYPAKSKKSENLSDLDKKDRNKRHSSPCINVVKGVFFVFRVRLVPVSYLSAPSMLYIAAG